MPPSEKEGSSKRAAPALLSSSSKRLRQEYSPSPVSGAYLWATPPRKLDSMYTFTSSKAKTVIDLTGSPSPRRLSSAARTAPFGAQAGPKRLEIRGVRERKINLEEYEENVWKKLETALAVIFAGEPASFSMEELYKGVENICKRDRAKVIYNKLKVKCEAHMKNTMMPKLAKALDETSKPEVLALAVQAWTTWKKQMTTVRAIFYYMDRSYLLHSPKEPVIQELAVQLFRKHIFDEPNLQKGVITGACNILDVDRSIEGVSDGKFDACHAATMKTAIEMFTTIGVYTKVFEPAICASSQTYFRNWSEQHKGDTLTEYIKARREMVIGEVNLMNAYDFAKSTHQEVVLLLNEFTIEKRKDVLINNTDEIQKLLRDNDTEMLQKLFCTVDIVGIGQDLQPTFAEYIITDGSEIIFDETQESQMVVRLLQFKAKLDNVWKFSFNEHKGLGQTLREAFEKFINKTKKSSSNWGTDNDKPGEMIAKYLDMILKGGSKAIPTALTMAASESKPANEEDADEDDAEDSQIVEQLDKVLELFRFVHGKAVFEAFYKKDLAKRLMLNRSASSDAEQKMLARLRVECGSGFTHNLEQMFKDIELSRDDMSAYKTMLSDTGVKQKIDFSGNVLSSAAWPTYPDVVVEIPQEIQEATKRFEQYYKLKHTGRRLAWKQQLAHCQIKATFPKGPKDLIVSGFQAIVMLYFNGRDGEQISYSELKDATKLEHNELKRTLQSLACARDKVLLKTPKGRDVNETDAFTVNLSFEHPKLRIKINQIQLKETKAENKATHERVAVDRQFETQAAIVRIMKSKKTVKNAVLVAEVIESLKQRGAVDAKGIKEQIEKLIDKDYMERDENDKGLFHYVS